MSTQPSCDLHLHTCYSDGRASPAELLRHAADIGLTTVAITDHDTIDGARVGIPIAAELGIELIPAIEFTSRWEASTSPDVDVLGYFVDFDSPAFCATVQAALDDIHGRIADLCARLSAEGYPLTLDDVRVENPRYAGAMQLIDTLVRKEYMPGWDAALALFADHWPQVRQSRFSIADIIATIRAAGGVAVLAHPSQVDCSAGWLQAAQIGALVEMGLGGMEIYHHKLDEAARAHFGALARQFGLLVTGGSDEHGWPSGFPHMGIQPVTREMVEALRQAAHST